MDKIVRSFELIGLVGGAPVQMGQLEQVSGFVRHWVAADCGARSLLDSGLQPEAVIGDLDSLGDKERARLPIKAIHHIREQDSTDFEKCMMRIEAPVVLGLGFLGGRLDHHLAALHALVRFPQQRCILLGGQDAVFLCPPTLHLDLPVGAPLSLFPMAPVSGRTAGLEYSFERLDYAPGGRIGTSNAITGPVEINMDAPAMLCIVPADHIAAIVIQLAAQPASWPAHA
jgi:thiamine pyrophosphokinase